MLSGKERELRRLSRAHLHRVGPTVVRGLSNLVSLSPLAYKRLKAILENEDADDRIVVAASRLLLRGFNDVLDRIGLPRRHEIDADVKSSLLTPELLSSALADAMKGVAQDPTRGAVVPIEADYIVIPGSAENGQPGSGTLQ